MARALNISNTDLPAILLAILTFNRNAQLSQLLSDIQSLELPPSFQVSVLVVDNDPNASARLAVERHQNCTVPISYIHEPKPGIPAARNRALEEAISTGALYLAFIDDDETPENDWLVQLLTYADKTNAQLIGGPVEVTVHQEPNNSFRKLLARSIIDHSRFLNNMRARRESAGKDPFRIATNNWFGDIRWIAKNKLRFDESLALSGGEDTVFYDSFLAAGGRPRWCSSAIVTETLDPKRVSISYQFTRFRSWGESKAQRGSSSHFSQTARLIIGLFLAVIPILGKKSPMLSLQLIGVAYGWIRTKLSGRRQIELYKRP